VGAKSDNAPAHNVISRRKLLVKKEIAALDQCPTPDLTLLLLLAFFQAESVVKGTHFLSLDEIKSIVTRELKSLQEEEFTRCFQERQEQMQKCINSKGEYFEGDHL